MGNILGSIFDLPIFNAATDHLLCKECEKISSNICEYKDKEEHWFKFLGPNGGTILVLTIGGLVVASLSVYILRGVFPAVGETAELFLDFIELPLEVVFKILEYSSEFLLEGTRAIAEKTHTYQELWRLLAFTAVTLALTETGYEISNILWKEPEDSYFWNTYERLNKPLEILNNKWRELFPSWWNPLRWFIFPFLGGAEILVCFLTPTLTLLNPYYWWDRYKKKPEPE